MPSRGELRPTRDVVAIPVGAPAAFRFYIDGSRAELSCEWRRGAFCGVETTGPVIGGERCWLDDYRGKITCITDKEVSRRW